MGHAVAIRMSSLGDVALTTGVLRYWGRTRGMRFSVVTRAEYAGLFRGHEAVEEVWPVGRTEARGVAWLAFCVRAARRARGSLLVDLHASLRSTVMRALWQGPSAVYPSFRAERRAYLKRRDGSARAVLLASDIPQRYAMALDSPAPPPQEVSPVVTLEDEERERAQEILASRGIGRPLVVVHPYSIHPAKNWPTARWVKLVHILEGEGWHWCVVGRSPHRVPVPARGDFTNQLGLRTLCAVLSLAEAVITPDSGPLHLARAVGTRVIALFGPTTREWGFYPSGARDVVLELPRPCRPCSLHGARPPRCDRGCLMGITPEDVVRCVGQVATRRGA